MVDFIRLGEQDFPVCFGFAALRDAEREMGKSVTEIMGGLGGVSLEDKVHICHLGLKHGSRREGKDFTLTIDQTADLLDEPGKFTELTAIVFDQLGKIFAPPEEKVERR